MRISEKKFHGILIVVLTHHRRILLTGLSGLLYARLRSVTVTTSNLVVPRCRLST